MEDRWQAETKWLKVCAIVAPFVGMCDPALGSLSGRIIAFSMVLGMIFAWMIATRLNPAKYQPYQFRFYVYAEVWTVLMICSGPTIMRHL